MTARMAWDAQDLGDGLVLHPVSSEADAAKYIALNELVAREGAIADRLLHAHPRTTFADYMMVEDTGSGKAVSTTCLIPWQLRFGQLTLDLAMLEMVVTHPDYRRRGLVRTQIQAIHQLAASRGFDACIIQGIPYYYRQFGYAYALDHTPRVTLDAAHVPASLATSRAYRFRHAVSADVAILSELYAREQAVYELSVRRSPEDWRYLLDHLYLHQTTLVENAQTGAPVGYWVTPPQTGATQCVLESACLEPAAASAMLAQISPGGAEFLELYGGNRHRLV